MGILNRYFKLSLVKNYQCDIFHSELVFHLPSSFNTFDNLIWDFRSFKRICWLSLFCLIFTQIVSLLKDQVEVGQEWSLLHASKIFCSIQTSHINNIRTKVYDLDLHFMYFSNLFINNKSIIIVRLVNIQTTCTSTPK